MHQCSKYMWRNKKFQGKSEMHYGSLSPYQFFVVMYNGMKEIQDEIPRYMMFANVIVLVGNNRTGANQRL